jgi:hypothetical protein
MSNPEMTWVLESDVFPNGDPIRGAALAEGHRVIDWSDEWWLEPPRRDLPEAVLFHGSLANAGRIAREFPWKPGVYCQTPAFHCSAYYPAVADWLIHDCWEIHPAAFFVKNSEVILDRLNCIESAFVRPDSPLKPFSGRVLPRGQITLSQLDHGFYYDDPNIDVVVAPVQRIRREWRYVVAGREVIAGCGYLAEGRSSTGDDSRGEPWRFAADLAERIPAPDPVYILDLCESERGLRLLELNPFSGADLYACDGSAIVRGVWELIRKMT